MAYPTDKEEFRRVVNQDLPDVPGDIVDEDDQNLPGDFLERLQDILGYNFLAGFSDLADRLDNISNKQAFKYHNLFGPFIVTITAGNFPNTTLATSIPITAGDKVIVRLSGIIRTNTANGGTEIPFAKRIDAGSWGAFGQPPYCDNQKANDWSPFSFTSESITIPSGSTISFRCNGQAGLGNGNIRQMTLEVYVI